MKKKDVVVLEVMSVAASFLALLGVLCFALLISGCAEQIAKITEDGFNIPVIDYKFNF